MNDVLWVLHCFRISETVHAVIKLKNNFQLTAVELQYLVDEFNELNDCIVPKPGLTMKIPILKP